MFVSFRGNRVMLISIFPETKRLWGYVGIQYVGMGPMGEPWTTQPIQPICLRCDVRLRGRWGHCRSLLGLDRHWRLSDDGPTRWGSKRSAISISSILRGSHGKPILKHVETLTTAIGFLGRSWFLIFLQTAWWCLIVDARIAFLACLLFRCFGVGVCLI